MKMADEKFCVRWTDFESNISVAFKELREEKDFFDVTLVCNEGQIQAHKVFTLFSVYTSIANTGCFLTVPNLNVSDLFQGIYYLLQESKFEKSGT